MLSGYDLQVLAFCHEEELPICRACALKRLAPITVARIERGLSTGSRFEIVTRYEVEHLAAEAGYECAGEDRGHGTPEGESCPKCDYLDCFDCGTTLSPCTEQFQQEARDAA